MYCMRDKNVGYIVMESLFSLINNIPTVSGAALAIGGQAIGSKLMTFIGLGLFIPSALQKTVNVLNVAIKDGKGAIQTVQLPELLILAVSGIAILGLVVKTSFLLNLLLLGGMALIVMGYQKQLAVPEAPKVEYKFIPRTFKEEQESPVKVSEIFSDMFDRQSPWKYSSDIRS